MAAGYQDHRGAFAQGIPDKIGAHPPRTHGADDIGMGRINHSPHTGRVRAGVGTPVAGESDYRIP